MKILKDMRSNTKKLFLFVLLLGLFWSFPIAAQEAEKTYECGWTKADVFRSREGNIEQCPMSKKSAASVGGRCSGNQASGMLCCCTDTALKAVEEKPTLFTIPDFQVTIPGLDKLATVTCDASDNCEIPWIGQYIAGIYNYALAIAGILAAIVLMGGGVMWLISGGDASRINQAKDLIIGSITGLIILACSYVILIQINPELTNFGSLTIKNIKKTEVTLATKRYGSTAEQYKNAACATDEELTKGVNFYATGYYKPAWENTEKFFCVVGMQCSCPNGRDTSKNCDFLYGKTFPDYHPCNYFEKGTEYCNLTSSGTTPKEGDIAAPNNCSNLNAGDKVCYNGKTYTIRDSGGGIKGRRIDIWSGDDLKKANSYTGVGTLKKGACN